MPNPLAHPAAAIPFTKAKLVFSALVFGSIAPDFGYFIKVGQGYFMYTLPGLLLFDLPVGFVLLWLFQTLAKWPLLSLLPIGLQRRLIDPARRFTFGPVKRFGLILLSLLVGSLTHIIWDSFTHDYGWVVENFAFFHTPIAGIPLYDLLQTLSTYLGIAILFYWFIRWLPKATRSEEVPARFSGKIQALFLALTGVALAIVEGLIFYSRQIAGAQPIHRHIWAGGSLRFSALFIVLFFLGIYCLTWIAAFHKTTRRSV